MKLLGRMSLQVMKLGYITVILKPSDNPDNEGENDPCLHKNINEPIKSWKVC